MQISKSEAEPSDYQYKHMSVYAVAISGGVDSAVTAAKLLKDGHDVFGVTMLLTDQNKDTLIEAAKTVADNLKIPHYICDLRTEFKKNVIDYFVNAYRSGLTPNPCAICNKKIKLSKLLQFAKNHGADYMATGHYAKLVHDKDTTELYEGANFNKDQSYFLSLTSIDHLKYIRFPLQNITDKSITRELAKSYGLPNFAKTDSQDICFVTNNDYVSVINKYSSTSNIVGDFVLNGKTVGKHNGIANYTIGQRKGLGISYACPLYVTMIDAKNNTITLGKRVDLLKNTFILNDVNFLSEISSKEKLFVKIRSGNKKLSAKVDQSKDGLKIKLLEPNVTAVCPGQVCAVYNTNGKVIAGGLITFE